jgi:hypothetical protein
MRYMLTCVISCHDWSSDMRQTVFCVMYHNEGEETVVIIKTGFILCEVRTEAEERVLHRA